jgi:hypothetical protein
MALKGVELGERIASLRQVKFVPGIFTVMKRLFADKALL